MRIIMTIMVMFLAGCSSTGVVPMDDGTYMIAKKGAQVGFGPPVGIKGDAYEEANEQCGREGRAVETIDLQEVSSGVARSAAVTLTFRCVGPSATSPVVPPPANGEDEMSQYDDLFKLNELRERGALTQEEFDREKAKILND